MTDRRSTPQTVQTAFAALHAATGGDNSRLSELVDVLELDELRDVTYLLAALCAEQLFAAFPDGRGDLPTVIHRLLLEQATNVPPPPSVGETPTQGER